MVDAMETWLLYTSPCIEPFDTFECRLFRITTIPCATRFEKGKNRGNFLFVATKSMSKVEGLFSKLVVSIIHQESSVVFPTNRSFVLSCLVRSATTIRLSAPATTWPKIMPPPSMGCSGVPPHTRRHRARSPLHATHSQQDNSPQISHIHGQ